MSFVFYIKPKDAAPTPETLSSDILELIKSNAPEIDKDDISYAKLDFILDIVGDPDLADLKFLPFEKIFKTKKGYQVLIIDTRQMNKGVAAGRFKIRRVWAEDKGKPYSIHALVESTTNELRHIGFERPILDDEVTMIVLEFNMPGGKKTGPFKFYLTVEDTMAEIGVKNTEDCDPQVGNDPP